MSKYSRSKAPHMALTRPRRRSPPPPRSCMRNAIAAPRRLRPDLVKQRRTKMRWCHDEPTLDDMLTDPLIETLMRADGVDAGELRPAFEEVAELISARDSRDACLRSRETR